MKKSLFLFTIASVFAVSSYIDADISFTNAGENPVEFMLKASLMKCPKGGNCFKAKVQPGETVTYTKSMISLAPDSFDQPNVQVKDGGITYIYTDTVNYKWDAKLVYSSTRRLGWIPYQL